MRKLISKVPWMYSGAFGLHATQHYQRGVNPFIILIPLLMIGHVWVTVGEKNQRKYYSIRFGWLLWSFEIYIRSLQKRKQKKD